MKYKIDNFESLNVKMNFLIDGINYFKYEDPVSESDKNYDKTKEKYQTYKINKNTKNIQKQKTERGIKETILEKGQKANTFILVKNVTKSITIINHQREYYHGL